jgi:heme/copper-type cytochrome/quinol oxidase subunit 2
MRLLLAAVPLLAARDVRACAICFGATDNQAGFFTGLSWAILTMLVVVLSLAGGIAYAMWSVEKERAKAEKKA